MAAFQSFAHPDPGWIVCGPATDRTAWHPLLTQFFDYWLAIHPALDRLPGRQHFDPLDIPQVMPRIWLLDVVRDGEQPRFRYRLVGTKEVETLQREVTGRWLDDVHPRLRESPALLDRYWRMAASGCATYRKGKVRFDHKREHARVENCMVPLARDGRTVDILAACSILYDGEARVI
jgi:hypothetical protein